MTDNMLISTDPVCGMPVDPKGAIRVDHEGTSYGFCDPACAEIFREDPVRWVVGSGGAPFAHEH